MQNGNEKNTPSLKASEGQRDKLEKLEKKLYSRGSPDVIGETRSKFDPNKAWGSREEEKEVKEGWEDGKQSGFDELALKMSRVAQSKHRFVRKIFFASLIFFVMAAGVAAFVFLGGVNMVSSRNVDIKVVGPLSIGSGQEVSLDINVINNNNVSLDSASLLVEYPEGTRSAPDVSKELDQDRFPLDDIKPGESYNQNIKLVFFGDKGDVKQLKMSLEYRVENSSALFYKEKIYDISISSAPLILTSTYPKEVNSNQDITFSLEVASNSKDAIDAFLVNVDYPFGFAFKSASPSPSFGNNVWQFSDFASGEKKTISIRGNIVGQDNEERVFKITAGTQSEDDERIIAIPFSELTESILVKKPFIDLSVLIGGKNGDFAASGGQEVTTQITLKNNLPSILYNAQVEVALKGAALNRQGVSPQGGGFFQSANDTILWDSRSVPKLGEMEPGSSERLSFSLTPLEYSSIKSGQKPEIEMTVTVKGERILESGSSEEVTSRETRKIVLATDVSLSSKVVRSLGNLENSGPVPPKADIPTTYTVLWSIGNSSNQISNVEVRATLPPYVKWKNLKSPQNETLSFNESKNEVVWNAGSLLPNTSPSQKQVYFQIEFLPSISQVGQSPELLSQASLTAIDKVTGLKIEARAPAATTNFSGDPSFRMGDDKVME